MTKSIVTTTIEIMGRLYHINSPITAIDSLQRSAKYVDEKMKSIRDTKMALSVDRIAVLAALNIANELFLLENQNNQDKKMIQNRLRELQNKVEAALAEHSQMELSPAE